MELYFIIWNHIPYIPQFLPPVNGNSPEVFCVLLQPAMSCFNRRKMIKLYQTNSNFAGAKWPSARCPCGAPGTEKDFRRSIRLGIPMSPGMSSMSDEADTLDWSHLHNLKGTCKNSFSVPGVPHGQRAEGHLAPAKFEFV